MRFLIIGGGLMGVTTAYFLRRDGHDVTVIDRQAGPGLDTSFANGALLTPSMSDPWNAPGSWRVLLASLTRADTALQLRLRALPGLASWGLTFLRNSSVTRFERNTLSNLRLALYSLKVMQSLRQHTALEYGRAALGTLRIFRDRPALAHATAVAERLSTAGLSFRALSTAATVALEPALAPIADQLAGALHYQADETGDAYRYCVALAEHARQLGVEFIFGTEVSALEVNSGRVTAALSDEQRFVADRYIVAAGSYSTSLLRAVAVRVPVQPAKGYSVTFEVSQAAQSLRTPVVDDHLHAALVPLEGALRLVGTAEFAGFDRRLNPARIRNLLRLLPQVLPRAQLDAASGKPWCGLRPMSADGVPIIGCTPVSNLLVNTGHGHLGWTMAAGSARLLVDMIAGRTPAIDPAPYALTRFSNAIQPLSPNKYNIGS